MDVRTGNEAMQSGVDYKAVDGINSDHPGWERRRVV